MQGTYKAPQVSDDKLTPAFVRDELLKCFESANGEFARMKGHPATDEQLKRQVEGFVKDVFSTCGASYVEPTKEGIMTAISECKNGAEKMMGADGAPIIEHHYSEMMKLVDRL